MQTPQQSTARAVPAHRHHCAVGRPRPGRWQKQCLHPWRPLMSFASASLLGTPVPCQPAHRCPACQQSRFLSGQRQPGPASPIHWVRPGAAAWAQWGLPAAAGCAGRAWQSCGGCFAGAGPARHPDAHGGHLQHIAMLVTGFAAHGDHAPVGFGARWRHLHHLAHHVQHV